MYWLCLKPLTTLDFLQLLDKIEKNIFIVLCSVNAELAIATCKKLETIDNSGSSLL